MRVVRIISGTGFTETRKPVRKTSYLGIECIEAQDPEGAPPGSVAYIPISGILLINEREEPDVKPEPPRIVHLN